MHIQNHSNGTKLAPIQSHLDFIDCPSYFLYFYVGALAIPYNSICKSKIIAMVPKWHQHNPTWILQIALYIFYIFMWGPWQSHIIRYANPKLQQWSQPGLNPIQLGFYRLPFLFLCGPWQFHIIRYANPKSQQWSQTGPNTIQLGFYRLPFIFLWCPWQFHIIRHANPKVQQWSQTGTNPIPLGFYRLPFTFLWCPWQFHIIRFANPKLQVWLQMGPQPIPKPTQILPKM